MRGPIVYVERDASGQRLTGLRLIGDQDEERFVVPQDAEAADAPRVCAEWLETRIDASESSHIGLMCLDPRGAVCSWLDMPGSDPSVVRAAVRQKSAGAWGDWPSMPGVETNETVESLVPIGGSSLKPLSASPETGGGSALAIRKKPTGETGAKSRRSAVLALGDLPVRVLLDELDARKIEVLQVTSLWHAIASAWDPAAEQRETDDPLVTTTRMDTAVILIEPGGRAEWAWCDEGKLLAAGSAMLEDGALAGDESARRFASGRLAMDWLAWSAQLGRSPRRVFCLVDDDAERSPSAGAFGEAVAGVWPGASVDLVRAHDPVLSTFLRLRERTAGGKARRRLDGSQQIEDLTSRPGRAHRAMYRWAALVFVLGAVALVILGYKLRTSAGDALREAADTSAETNGLVLSELGEQADPLYPILSLQSAIDRAALERQTGDIEPVHPVLLALEELSVFSQYMTGVTITRLVVDQSFLTLTLEADDAEDAESSPLILKNAIYADWRVDRTLQRGGKTIVTLLGMWRNPEDQGGSQEGGS